MCGQVFQKIKNFEKRTDKLINKKKKRNTRRKDFQKIENNANCSVNFKKINENFGKLSAKYIKEVKFRKMCCIFLKKNCK